MFRYYAQCRQISLGKFVIPNPFGPYEERRFTHYLIKNWFAGATPSVNTPAYVRDNIHASLLAKAYVNFITTLANGISRIRPSGYIESQASFADRVANEMRGRLGLKCEFVLNAQTEFSEPRIRINTDVADTGTLSWSEMMAWDAMANYYAELMTKSS